MKWVDKLSPEELQFMDSWAPRCDVHGSVAESWRVVRPGAPARDATKYGSKTLHKLQASMNQWVESGRTDDLPPLTREWLLEQLDDIARIPGIADNNLGQAMMLRQKLDPVDTRTYRDFVVDYLKPRQWEVYTDPARYRVVVAGRQSGKTHLAATELITKASEPNRKCYYVGLTIKAAKGVAWPIFKRLLNFEYVAKLVENEAYAVFTNGSEIHFEGAEKAENLRGLALDFLVLDEIASWKRPRKNWEEILRPTLATTEGRALFIGTPQGYNYLRRLFLRGGNPEEKNWSSHTYTTMDAGVVSPAEVEEAKRGTDPRSFRQEWEASFEQLANQVYDYFDRSVHVTEDIAEAGDEILVGIDFNLQPMSAVLCQKDENGGAEILEALELPYSNTDELLDEVEMRYPDRTFIAYPDPTGRKRQTSAGGRTDYSIIEERTRWKVDPVMYRKPIPLADRINNSQANLRTADGVYHTKIHPVKGLPLIEALEGLTYAEGTSVPDKTTGLDHIIDAWGYVMYGAFNRFRKKASIGTVAL